MALRLLVVEGNTREARLAQKEAERQRAEAELHQEKAALHEQGHADHELIDDHERDRFAGTSADATATDRTATTGTSGDGRTEFEEGREVGHEEERGARFDRTDETTDTTPGSRRA